jgi:hypothetical protein
VCVYVCTKGIVTCCYDIALGVNYNVYYQKNELRLFMRPWILREFYSLEVARTFKIWGREPHRKCSSSSVTKSLLLTNAERVTWFVLLYAQKYIFYFLNVDLDCFRRKLGRVLWNNCALLPFVALPHSIVPSLLFSDDRGWGGCPNRPYIWVVVINFLGLAKEMFLLLLSVAHHLGEFWQLNLVLQAAWRGWHSSTSY